jgi:predicted SAM-dependent methyltransferase
MLNVGCGRHFHTDWENIDLAPTSPNVRPHDATTGLPYESNSFDSVYHSHILEHLTPEQGQALTQECFRVLKPGGILRVVIPDLEKIAALYLRMHDQAWKGDAQAADNYQWMKLELLDQMVRAQSGGKMGQFMSSSELKNSKFVHSRIGVEVVMSQRIEIDNEAHKSPEWKKRLHSSVNHLLEQTARLSVRLLLGPRAEEAFEEGLFRSRGEVHRWMYDRFSLKTLCEEVGFADFSICQAQESRIPNFASFELDAVEGQVRKPDSLFGECCKPT